jgi:hydrogenase maturation protease
LKPQILVACIGNIFLGDDGFGVEVARALASRRLTDEVKLVDFGIRGFDLTYALMDGYELVLFVDAVPRGGEPGTLYVIEPDLSELDTSDPQALMVEPHGMKPLKVLTIARSMGAAFRKILIVGCEPATLGGDEGEMGLSEKISAAVPAAVDLVESLIAQHLREFETVAAA